nr:hypothetical protein [Brevibacillus laterosporus]
MRNIITTSIIISGSVLLTACSTTINQTENTLKPAGINVEIAIPESLQPNQVSSLQVKLTDKNKPISDAEDVQLKIWQVNQEQESKRYKAAPKADKTDNNTESKSEHRQGDSAGVYESNVIFREGGVYYVQAYVKAHGLSLLPTKSVIVGNLSREEQQALEKERDQQGDQAQQDHSHHY